MVPPLALPATAEHDWAIVGAGVRPYDVQMREKLKAQDYLTTLIELDPSGMSAEVVGSMIDYVPQPAMTTLSSDLLQNLPHTAPIAKQPRSTRRGQPGKIRVDTAIAGGVSIGVS